VIVSIIAAMDRNRLIGNNNQLPWHLPADLAHFKKITIGKPVVMGRKTYESIGKPLPSRTNIILTRSGYRAEGIKTASSLEQAIDLVPGADELMIIGGSSVYEMVLPLVDRMYLTFVDAEFSGDAWFPEYDESRWQQSESTELAADERNTHACRFVRYDKKM